MDLAEREYEYLRRLGRYTTVEIEEVKGKKGESRKAVAREGERLLARTKGTGLLVVLTEKGISFDSEGFSDWMKEAAATGLREITFVVGGAAGLDDSLIGRADVRLSLSPMTLPHQLARLVLVEQIYRAFTIMRGEPYHK